MSSMCFCHSHRELLQRSKRAKEPLKTTVFRAEERKFISRESDKTGNMSAIWQYLTLDNPTSKTATCSNFNVFEDTSCERAFPKLCETLRELIIYS